MAYYKHFPNFHPRLQPHIPFLDLRQDRHRIEIIWKRLSKKFVFNSWLFLSDYFNLCEEVQLKMGHVQKNEVLAKFMENGEWDFHHVEAFPHSPEVEQHPSNSSAQGKAKIIK